MKKVIAILVLLVVLALTLTACGKDVEKDRPAVDGEEDNVVETDLDSFVNEDIAEDKSVEDFIELGDMI